MARQNDLPARERAGRGRVPITVACRVLKLARQPYYRWREHPVTEADSVQAHRINALHDAHHEDPTFGYRFLAHEAKKSGWRMSRRTAWSLCSTSGILSAAQRRRRGKGKKAGPPVFDDHVQRIFTADAPNRVWLTDITEHRTTGEGKVYCCAIKDLYANRIVGYSISDRMTAQLAVDALNNAVTRRKIEGQEVAGCILHADRGSQFRSRKMAHALNRHGMVGSMGRVGAAGDNAAMESFWSLLQTNVLNQRRWTTRNLSTLLSQFVDSVVESASSGLLIQVVPGRFGGSGCLRTNLCGVAV